ncbi:hypothetical protein CERSUDRAFT_94998 [Gelatoporia subvermispora B]|uniref:ATPase dynein-related AAA domain-containing protein n=1 Tax=Ceriporiopsis subvermispora (strain B) TaxID=914234 RepID=M2RD32_CERS8|nr:hypothetical protein CERSUDRAFT_94998 [Gelatoporia subvermispora B]
MTEGEGEHRGQVIGEVEEVDYPLFYGVQLDGTCIEAGEWIMPALEVKRITASRNEHLQDQGFYEVGVNGSSNFHGVLPPRSSLTTLHEDTRIETPTTVQSLRALAIHYSLRVPALLTSAPSSGKSLLLSHPASVLHPEVHNQIATIRLADTSLDQRLRTGSYISSPTQPRTFKWREGVLVCAVCKGRWSSWIGGRAILEVSGRGTIRAEDGSAIFATRSNPASLNGAFPNPTFFGAHNFYNVIFASLTAEDRRMVEITPPVTRLFAMHRPAVQLISRIATSILLNEPVLLTGEIGTGKTSAVARLLVLLHRLLISLNLSNQTVSSVIVGGSKLVDMRAPAMELGERFLELFARTFSLKKNAKSELRAEGGSGGQVETRRWALA